MTKKKIMMTAMSAGLVAVIGVGGTLAYLSAQSEVVNNTFTVGTGYIQDEDGNVGIVLDEAKVMDDGSVDAETRTDENQEYPKMMPGDSRLKDPTVRFVAGSVKSYVFAKVEGVEYAAENHLTIDGWNTQNWMKVEGSGEELQLTDNTGDGIYMYVGNLADDNYVVDFTEEVEAEIYEKGEDVSLGYIFNNVAFDNVSNEEFDKVGSNFNDAAIKVSACAVQAADDGSTWVDAYGEATFKK